MKIGIDASRAFRRERTGTENYAHELIARLARRGAAGDQFFLYVKKGTRIDLELPGNFSVRQLGGTFLWTQLRLSFEMLRHPVDVLFIPAHAVPLLHPRRTVATVHGLEYERLPDCYSWQSRLLLRLNTRLSVRFARDLIAPSESTKRDLIRFYGVDPTKITVIAHGAEESVPRTEPEQPDEFNLLFLGRLEKRKNILGLIRAFEIFMEKIPAASRLKTRLILAGKPGYGFREIETALAASPCRENVSLPGYVSEEAKDRLFAKASVFLFPSLYEGFGLPVLEAMSRGVPVISADNSSLAEIADEAALRRDPCDAKAISEAILAFFEDACLRETYRQRGYENLQRFSWEVCAKQTLALLKRER